MSHWLTDSNKNSKSSILLAFSIIKNILPLVDGVVVDDHTLEKISKISSRVIFFFQSVIFFHSCGNLP